jgi:hypothetical protein
MLKIVWLKLGEVVGFLRIVVHAPSFIWEYM